MSTKILGCVTVATTAVIGIGLGAWLFAAPPARAVVDTSQVISGGSSMAQNSGPLYTAPGLGNQFGTDFPGTGLGPSAAQINMPAGTLSRLKVKLTTQNVPTNGSFTLVVQVNGADTNLTCTLTSAGQCSAGNKTKGLGNNSLLAVRVLNTFTDSGLLAYTYTMQLD